MAYSADLRNKALNYYEQCKNISQTAVTFYSPELNPIEKVWANIKRYLRTVLSDYARFDDAILSYFVFN